VIAQELPERTQPHQAPIRAQVDVKDPRKEESISTMERGVQPGLCQAGQRPRRPTVWLLPGPGAAEQGLMHGVCEGIFARPGWRFANGVGVLVWFLRLWIYNWSYMCLAFVKFSLFAR